NTTTQKGVREKKRKTTPPPEAPFFLRPPFIPPLRELDLLRFLPRPPPPFLRPPRSDLLTVAHARRSASLLLTPRFLYPLSILDAFRFCLDVYFFFPARAMMSPPAFRFFGIRTNFVCPLDLGPFGKCLR